MRSNLNFGEVEIGTVGTICDIYSQRRERVAHDLSTDPYRNVIMST